MSCFNGVLASCLKPFSLFLQRITSKTALVQKLEDNALVDDKIELARSECREGLKLGDSKPLPCGSRCDCSSARPTAQSELRHWPSFLLDAAFLREPGGGPA